MTEESPPTGVPPVPGSQPFPPSRVLHPPGATPAGASRLDPDPRLRHGEALVRIEAVWLDADAETAVARSSGGAPQRMRAALLEATTERGALPPGFEGAILVGRVAEQTGTGPPPGRRVAVAGVTGVPAWLRDVSGWTGGRLVPADGHAVLPPGAEVLVVDDVHPPAVAGALGAAGHVPALVEQATSLRSSGDVVVLGGGSVGGVLALVAGRAAGRRVAAVVSTLAEARTARALGAGLAPIVSFSTPAEASATLVDEVAGWTHGAPAIVVVAGSGPGVSATAGLVAARWGALVVSERASDAAAVSVAAAGAGCSPVVLTGRTLRATEGRRTVDLLAAEPVLAEVAAWRAGVAAPPAVSRPEDP